MRKFWCLGGCFLVACSSGLPTRTKDVSSFVPLSPQQQHEEAEQQEKIFVKRFPKHCRWEELVRVIDGDTVVVGSDERVRLVGIDTPETHHPTKGKQPFGEEATQALGEMLAEADKVCLITDQVGDTQDIYDRTLAYLFRTDGLDINTELIKRGFARAYLYFPFERKEEFRFWAQEAKRLKFGLWAR